RQADRRRHPASAHRITRSLRVSIPEWRARWTHRVQLPLFPGLRKMAEPAYGARMRSPAQTISALGRRVSDHLIKLRDFMRLGAAILARSRVVVKRPRP